MTDTAREERMRERRAQGAAPDDRSRDVRGDVFKIAGEAAEERACIDCGKPFTTRVVRLVRDRTLGGSVRCPDCDVADQEREAEREASERAKRMRDRVVASGLPRQLRNVSFSGFRNPAVQAAAEGWVETGGGLHLWGEVGVGKTRLAAAAANALLRRRSISWESVATLMTKLRFGFEDEARKAAGHLIAGHGALVLDDIDKINPTEYGCEVLYTAINNRVESGSPLLLTSNVMPSELGNRFGKQISSRIVGYCRVWEMTGADRRLEEAAA